MAIKSLVDKSIQGVWDALLGAINPYTGAISLRGKDGVTVTHNIGNINYLVKVLPTGADGQSVGEITYIKAANTVTIYNTGEGSQYHASINADIEITQL